MIAVRPPEYWPRPEYFALMDEVDVFVLADTFQYSRQSFQNRARLRTPDGWQWISIPLKGGQHGCPIGEVAIRRKLSWTGKQWRALHFNYRTTPFFEFYEPRLRPFFDREWTCLGDVTAASVDITRDLLGVRTPLRRASELEGSSESLPAVMQRLAEHDLLIPREAAPVDARHASSILDFDPPQYRQNFEGFEPGMSALDLLFNYGPEALRIIRTCTKIIQTSN